MSANLVLTLLVRDEADIVEANLDFHLSRGVDFVIATDNGSVDGSAEVARRLGATVVSEPRRGFGAACFAGLLAARSEVVCFMDCDASLDPAALPLLVGYVERNEFDLVLGSRVARRGAWPVILG